MGQAALFVPGFLLLYKPLKKFWIMEDILPFCSIVVLNWNGREHLEECFSSLSEINYPKGSYEVIMVDNGSSDDSIDFVKKKFPWVRILALDKNYGFAEGNNRGMKEAKGDYILVLGNDLKVDKNFLVELVKPMLQDDKIAVCGSKILDYKNPKMIQYAGATLDITGAPNHRGSGKSIPASMKTLPKSSTRLIVLHFTGRPRWKN